MGRDNFRESYVLQYRSLCRLIGGSDYGPDWTTGRRTLPNLCDDGVSRSLLISGRKLTSGSRRRSDIKLSGKSQYGKTYSISLSTLTTGCRCTVLAAHSSLP